jgi:hypothetical protein
MYASKNLKADICHLLLVVRVLAPSPDFFFSNLPTADLWFLNHPRIWTPGTGGTYKHLCMHILDNKFYYIVHDLISLIPVILTISQQCTIVLAIFNKIDMGVP